MSNSNTSLYQSEISSLSLLNQGKVRDIYTVDADHLLIVTSDRISAFDVVLPDPIPGKGRVLTTVSNFWFARTQQLVANHLTDRGLDSIGLSADEARQLAGRAIVVKRLSPLPVEAIVRGYIIGSGWKDYQRTGAVCGIELPAGLQQAQQLPEPIFTPSTKAAAGAHDENISFAQAVELLGPDLADKVRRLSLTIYQQAAQYAAQRGIIIADTKLEFGLDANGELYLIDEVLTPDSSRFWPADSYRVGISPPSFDKQYLRDYLETQDWNKQAPGPALPQEVIEQTAAKYREAQDRLLE
ncbi:MAG: phosphoribosylaminoimidazolesuccinocarboxamide synthase [Gammaproteobacteria bacterium]|nr:phosphoribosylaminoimidazolesuccinocarboxamide synthase [Gammaproteobacteria bacterium]MCY4281614.1 phosphoribosylaminoimidazolesuccinocarboxamide synthase [Gammaproteobacteria bacterium]MCY4337784.1 phosphoribosylaminoimidazolesuccinocarboxamide synthase [Gammaproteobacteria bacterium]